MCTCLAFGAAAGQRRRMARLAENHHHPEKIFADRCAMRHEIVRCLGLFLLCSASLAPRVHDANEQATPVKSPVIVVGFVGGFVRHDNAVHTPVQLAARLGSVYPSGVYVEVFENRRREDAHQKILKLLDADHEGKLSDQEKRDARIIIYGMSWGGSETVALARELGDEKIPVLLTIQVDSITKPGQNDALIPANVAEAANFYQTDGLLHGQSDIRAVDTSRTRILGNFRYDYKSHPLACENYPWYDRYFAKQHTAIECDRAVWNRVESLIRSKLPPAGTLKLKNGNP